MLTAGWPDRPAIRGIPVDTFSGLKLRLDRAAAAMLAAEAERSGQPVAPLRPWRWHDFRRSFATALGEAGVAEAVADAILNHRQSATRGGVLGVYQRSQRWPEQVAAMERWGEMLAAAIAGRPVTSATILPMPSRTAQDSR